MTNPSIIIAGYSFLVVSWADLFAGQYNIPIYLSTYFDSGRLIILVGSLILPWYNLVLFSLTSYSLDIHAERI